MNTLNFYIHKKIIVLFGLLFYNTKIRKYREDNIRNTEDDTKILEILQEIVVPISFASKDKLIARYKRRELSKKGVAMTMPRMAFQITNVYYDKDRALNKLHKYISSTSNNSVAMTQYTPVPYNFDIELSILASKQSDATRIVEQILPRFTPDIKITTNLVENNDIKIDIPIVLNNVYLQDNYEGVVSKERIIIWGLNFTAKGYLFGEILESNLITNTISNISLDINKAESVSIVANTGSNFINDFGFTETYG